MLLEECTAEGQLETQLYNYQHKLQQQMQHTNTVQLQPPPPLPGGTTQSDYLGRSSAGQSGRPQHDMHRAELHGLSPPQLSMPAAGPAVRKRVLPPLFGNPGPAAPATAALPLPRLPAHDEATEAEVTANPLGVAQEERQQEAQQDEWEEHRSTEHGNQVYWFNTNTRESTWEKPRELMLTAGPA